MPDLRLSEIWIYPIKSLGGIRLDKAIVLPKGLEHDRRWMLVDEQNRFITQREHPELALFQLTINNKQLTILHQANQQSVQFNINTHSTYAETVTIWDDQVQAFEVDQTISKWFSDQLKMKCRLMHFPETNSRPVDTAYAIKNDQVSLADGYPFLIIGQSSLDDLNKRLPDPISMQRFRPNFVFTGGDPYEEDHWKNFTIGEVKFVGVKNCSRCVLTTVDPKTGIKGKEPLQTLSTYRKRNNKIYFGHNVLAVTKGVVHAGDTIRLS
ncbi:MAG: MOSC domain-containing protein [Cyclobacteriaceae bacterium]|nr:MOSC domain-containing protein [Cyclobacteriaceae bacterium]UYN86424.1 MAG: MOSC domain-containing protein [Cyclobacteriaceae bacterium]